MICGCLLASPACSTANSYCFPVFQLATILQFCVAAIVPPLSGYTIDIPGTAVVVSDLTTLEVELSRYPSTALNERYGGWVIEIGGRIVVAMDDNMTFLINENIDRFDSFISDTEFSHGQTRTRTTARCDATNPKSCLQNKSTQSSDPEGRVYIQPMCFFSSLCWTCKKSFQYRPGASSRGYCIECNLYTREL